MKWRTLGFTTLTTVTLLACQLFTNPSGPAAKPATGSPVPATRLPGTKLPVPLPQPRATHPSNTSTFSGHPATPSNLTSR
jgi:hypothetical protein